MQLPCTKRGKADRATDYQRRVAAGLSRAFDARETEQLEHHIGGDRLVVFSDHHRGTRDGADDFWRCERAYRAALGHYLESGFRLVLLGDVEELWENEPEAPLEAYADVLELEAAFHHDGRLWRVWGNHDDAWRSSRSVRRLLAPRFPGLRVREALSLRVTDGGAPLGTLFLVHGHQGTLDAERWAWASRLFVRHIWRPLQRRLGLPSTTPSRDHELRERHDVAMHAWARSHPDRPVLVAGHTHRPVFGSTQPAPPAQRPAEEVARALADARAAGAPAEDVAALRAELELARAPRFGRPPQPMDPPCYYNTGCCSFGDGDVTGLELAGGRMRLVRWLDDQARPAAKVLAEDDLRSVLAAVRAG